MTAPRPFALVTTCDQWIRSAFEGTTLDRAEGTVELAWRVPAAQPGNARPPALGGGLAFDAACRLFHSVPDGGRVERIRWGMREPIPTRREPPVPVPLFASASPDAFGSFAAESPSPVIREPRGIAVDRRDRLWIAESGADRILVYDLWDARLLGVLRLPGERPVALAVHRETVYAVLAGSGRVVTVSLRTGVSPVAMPPEATPPSRIAISARGRLAVLAAAPTADAMVVFPDAATDAIPVPFATDLVWESDITLVVAREPDADFLRYNVELRGPAALGPLRARGYDGLGIAVSPERNEHRGPRSCRCGGGCGSDATPHWIVYWTARGPRTAVPARLTYTRAGRVVTFQLDSGVFQADWGRLFLDACIPDGTNVQIRCLGLDEVDDEPTLPRTPPAGVSTAGLRYASPPMPPARLATGDAQPPAHPLHRRETGRELPWTQPPAGDLFRTYEAPIGAVGRYLWVTLELAGNTQVTPRVRSLRAEHAKHDFRARLPRTYSRDALAADFLDRYLAVPDSFLGEADGRSQARHALLHPYAVPDQMLRWLASFVGLVLDDRWSKAPRPAGGTADARREIIAAVAELWRYRGTARGLRKFLELYLDVPVAIIEQYRLRGMGGGAAGSAVIADAVLGGGFRVGAPIGEVTPRAIEGSTADAFTANAHRFTVLVPASLDAEQLDVIRHILEVHRPAHTLVEVCTVDAGMRVGRGLHLELSTIVGPTGGFGTVQLGRSALGRGAILGRPRNAATVGSAAVGEGLRIG
jgi:phage tail-like protein